MRKGGEPAAGPLEEVSRRFELSAIQERLAVARKKEKKHLLWLVLGVSPAAALPAVGLLLEGSSELLLILLLLVAVSQAFLWNRAAREAERLEKELARLSDGEDEG